MSLSCQSMEGVISLYKESLEGENNIQPHLFNEQCLSFVEQYKWKREQEEENNRANRIKETITENVTDSISETITGLQKSRKAKKIGKYLNKIKETVGVSKKISTPPSRPLVPCSLPVGPVPSMVLCEGCDVTFETLSVLSKVSCVICDKVICKKCTSDEVGVISLQDNPNPDVMPPYATDSKCIMHFEDNLKPPSFEEINTCKDCCETIQNKQMILRQASEGTINDDGLKLTTRRLTNLERIILDLKQQFRKMLVSWRNNSAQRSTESSKELLKMWNHLIEGFHHYKMILRELDHVQIVKVTTQTEHIKQAKWIFYVENEPLFRITKNQLYKELQVEDSMSQIVSKKTLMICQTTILQLLFEVKQLQDEHEIREEKVRDTLRDVNKVVLKQLCDLEETEIEDTNKMKTSEYTLMHPEEEHLLEGGSIYVNNLIQKRCLVTLDDISVLVSDVIPECDEITMVLDDANEQLQDCGVDDIEDYTLVDRRQEHIDYPTRQRKILFPKLRRFIAEMFSKIRNKPNRGNQNQQ